MTSAYWDFRTARWEGGEPEHVVPPAWAAAASAAPPAPAAVPAAPAQRESVEPAFSAQPGGLASG